MNSKKDIFLQNNHLKNTKFLFSRKKETTINSLFEVENFLSDFKSVLKYLKLYKILK